MTVHRETHTEHWDNWLRLWESGLEIHERMIDHDFGYWDPQAAQAWSPEDLKQSAARGIRTLLLRQSTGGE